MKRSEALRIVDANFNRSREGLRVCEEVSRFILKDPALTKRLKEARHAISDCLKRLNVSYVELVTARNVRADFGKKPSRLERSRKSVFDLFVANIERSKESLRVLEETLKFIDIKTSVKIKKIRFNAYTIEKKSLSKLATLRHNG